MTALTHAELALLDFLCAAHHQRCRVTQLKGVAANLRLGRLWGAGLVEPNSYAPTAWAMHDWRTRQAFPAFNETPVPSPHGGPSEPPAPRAVCKRRKRGASRTAREAPSAMESTVAEADDHSIGLEPPERVKDRAPPPSVDINVNSVTGANLLAEIEPFLVLTGLNRTEFSLRVFGYPGALSDLSGRRRQIPKPETIKKVRRFIADNPDLRIEAKPRGEITGDQLADELDTFIAEHGLARSRVAKAALGHSSDIASLRRYEFPKPLAIERVRSFLADPGPLEDLKPGKREPQSRRNPDAETLRRQRAINSSTRAQAMKRIEDGLPVGDVKDVPVRVRCAQIQLEKEIKEQARLACPVEQAKTVLRRRYAPVVGAEVVGGPKGQFVVGRKTVTESELLKMAEGMRG